MSALVACPACSRHVRTSESNCPFCREELAVFLLQTRARPLPTERLSRALLLTFAAASVSAAACGGETDDGKGQALTDAGGDAASGGEMGTPVYGAPAPTGGMTGAGGEGAGGDLGAPEYGAPPPPTGGRPSGAGGTPGTGGGVAPVYGAPPP